ncbi:PTS system IIB component (L-Asc family) [Trichococcus patagoniensis]|uniref:PTS system IIB component (L-Asc family) n=1 Tax=Trichococcus patagoniensis TaxID=382641 RepID=A0A2T5IGN5_9LACT|nr:PTS sugar transporter subunit IIB [Trichococcus patagoniensis]PTQ82949.1 PTS system IIB component (L-Asc family) [Trichococcus patagoniensis]
MKVLAACGSGMGSSQIIKMKITNVFKKLDIPLEIHHCAVSEAKTLAASYDVVVCSNALLDVFKNVDQSKTKIIGLKNLLSEKEIEEKVREIVLGE